MEKSEKYLACLHWLEQIEDKTIREAAISQMDAERIEESSICYSKSDAVMEFADWSKTNEGVDFWCEVHNYCYSGSLLPEHPKHVLLQSRVNELEEALREILKLESIYIHSATIAHQTMVIAEEALKGGGK